MNAEEARKKALEAAQSEAQIEIQKVIKLIERAAENGYNGIFTTIYVMRETID